VGSRRADTKGDAVKAAVTPASVFPGVGVAVKAGDTLNVLAWSNAAFTLRGIANFRSIQGDAPTSLIVDVVVTSNRTLSTANAVIPQDGVIDACAFDTFSGTTPTQRGQCFVAMWMTRGGTTAAYAALTQGYFYTGSILTLGFYEEPGPAGGHGALRSILTADPAAGSEIATTSVPTGAIWRLESFSAQLVQGITQTPLPTLRIRSGGVTVSAQIPITTTAIGASSTAQLTWMRGAVQSSFTTVVGDEFHTAPAPAFYLIAGDAIDTVTDGIGANTNYGIANLTAEEWVMPN